MTTDPPPPASAFAGFVVEWLCALWHEPDAAVVRDVLAHETARQRGVDLATARAWVAGREPGAAETAGTLQTCPCCGKLMSNLLGVFLMHKPGAGIGPLAVCASCSAMLAEHGWTVKAVQK